ncbi:hypothetical protein EX30DRAFT_371787 [Ascodesmis nigricans]|uniref:Uncharacterized protein n=1 Tax=Ascodesmis nigricans TaxID=341454 RepID=A0A4S2MWV7_9PEZI|nr:hypothetical protein EX30DRAFT_371787 [Ascodesmis nigricans]
MYFTSSLLLLASAAIIGVTTAADIAIPTFNPKICPIRCPDGHVIRDPCGTVYIRDPCWNHQTKPKLCTHTCPDGYIYTDVCGTVYVRDPCADHQKPEESGGVCAWKCKDGTVLVFSCSINFIQDPCVAAGHGGAVQGPTPQKG